MGVYPLSPSCSFYHKSHEVWERFKEVCKAEGKSVSHVLSEYVDSYLIGYIDPTIPSLSNYFEAKPNSIEAVQHKISQDALARAQKLGGDINSSEIRQMYIELSLTPHTRNSLVKRTTTFLKLKGIKVWQ